MGLNKEAPITIFLVILMSCTFQILGQPSCTSHLVLNSTVDFDKYNTTGFHVLEVLTTSRVADCSLFCCLKENCSLVVLNEDVSQNCFLINCVMEEACAPVPSNTSQLIQSIKAVNTMTRSFTSPSPLSGSIDSNLTPNSSQALPKNVTLMKGTTASPSSSHSALNLTDSSTNNNLNAEQLASNATVTESQINSDNITEENTTRLNGNDTQQHEPMNTTQIEETLGTTENNTQGPALNETTGFKTPGTEKPLPPPTTPDANQTSSLENGTMGNLPNLNGTTTVNYFMNGSDSISRNSTNATHAISNGQGLSSNQTEKEEADSSENVVTSLVGSQSMMIILVATLSVGMLLFIAIVAVVSKKAVDGWQRRHYSRIDYLVNGMYN